MGIAKTIEAGWVSENVKILRGSTTLGFNKMIPPKGIATAIKLTLRGSLILLTGQNFGEYFFGKIFSAKKNLGKIFIEG